jgi:KipI family sensor histidine kinase inhibitor
MARRAIYVRYSLTIDEQANSAARALASALAADPVPGVRELYPGLASTYVEWDPNQVSDRVIDRWLGRALSEPAPREQEAARDLAIPIRYDGADLDDVSRETGLAKADVVRAHRGARYTVLAVGAGPGQPFLGINSAVIDVARRSTPRFKVPDRSVAIAGRLTTVYRGAIAGGWNLIGTALMAFYDPNRDDPCLFHPGDRVSFIEGPPRVAADVQALIMLPEQPAFPALRVEKAGPLDLVVDKRRTGVAGFGLAESGPMDPASANWANELVGNPRALPVLESTLTGPTLIALRPLRIAVFGPGTRLEINGDNVNGGAVEVSRGARIRVRPNRDGARGYLAIAGGIESRHYLGCASADMSGLIGRKLADGDVLGAGGAISHVRTGVEVRARKYAAAMKDSSGLPIRLIRGPQYSREAHRALTDSAFTVTTGDRSGVRFEGPPVPGGELLSESPPLGTVQVTPAGSPIILMNDRQRSAGYFKPGVVCAADLPRVAQLRPGSRVRFAFLDQGERRWYIDQS